MKIDRFDLHLERYPESGHQPYFLAGEEIKANIEVAVRERVRIARLSLRLIGTSYTAWQDGFTDIAYESKELFLEEYRDLTSDLSVFCNEAMEILYGNHRLDFRIKLPNESISSIEKGGFGYVKYSIISALDIPEDGGDSEIVAEAEFNVHSLLSLDSPHFLKPVQSTEQFFFTRSWLCLGKSRRWIQATLHVSSLGLLPGENCTVSLTVENTVKKARLKKHDEKEHQCALVSLCQQMDFRSRAKYAPHIRDRRSITTAVQSYGICKGNFKAGADTRQINFEIPLDLPPTSTKENGLIACSYFFRIEIEEHLDVIVPVVIGSHKTLEEIGGGNET